MGKKITKQEVEDGQFLLRNLVTKTAAYTATVEDYVILCDGTFTVTLPTASEADTLVLNIKNTGTGTVTVDGNGSGNHRW